MDNYIKNQIDIINQKIKEMNALYHMAAGKSGIADGEVCIWSALLNSDEEYTQQDLCEMLSLTEADGQFAYFRYGKKRICFVRAYTGNKKS